MSDDTAPAPQEPADAEATESAEDAESAEAAKSAEFKQTGGKLLGINVSMSIEDDHVAFGLSNPDYVRHWTSRFKDENKIGKWSFVPKCPGTPAAPGGGNTWDIDH